MALEDRDTGNYIDIFLAEIWTGREIWRKESRYGIPVSWARSRPRKDRRETLKSFAKQQMPLGKWKAF